MTISLSKRSLFDQYQRSMRGTIESKGLRIENHANLDESIESNPEFSNVPQKFEEQKVDSHIANSLSIERPAMSQDSLHERVQTQIIEPDLLATANQEH